MPTPLKLPTYLPTLISTWDQDPGNANLKEFGLWVGANAHLILPKVNITWLPEEKSLRHTLHKDPTLLNIIFAFVIQAALDGKEEI